ncbi:MAG TPA: pyridoxal kinase PdxY [Nocardioidaceae bacterium]|nr:pyridoxal kinase PdxY [Nocardioidaceae bacterium]
MKNILSIQSLVAYGHAGNSAALFPLQRLGFDVWPVITVHFSNHTGYGEARGPLLTSSDIAEVIRGVEDRGALDRCDAVLSGYQGAEDVGAVILDAVRNVKERNPEAIYFCDPVMGDVGRGFFVRPGIPEFMRDKVVPAADVITPNQFELAFLAGTETRTIDEVVDAADFVRSTGPSVVLVTSAITEETPEDSIDMVAVSDEGAWIARTPRLPINPPGAGDLTSAVFLANVLDGHDLPTALARTTSSVYAVMEATAEAGTREMCIVAAQDALATPAMQFEVNRVSDTSPSRDS